MNENTGTEQPKAPALMKRQTIVSLQVQNVKKVTSLHIFPNGNVIGIGGKNGAGKSTVLDAILYACNGGNTLPEMPITTGKTKAQIVVELQDLIVTRKFSASGTQLVVTTREGVTVSSPQGVLDKLTGTLSFDPASFSTIAEREPKKALEILRKLVGLDFTTLDATRKRYYDERTGVNRDIQLKQGKITAFPFYENVGDAEVTTATLLQKLETAQKTNSDNNAKRQALATAKTNVASARVAMTEKEATVERLRRELAQTESELKLMKDGLELAEQVIANDEKNVALLVDADEQPIKDEMATVDSTNEKVRANSQRKTLQRELMELQSKSGELDEKISGIDKEKADQLAAVKFPIPSLSFNDAGVLLDGVPFAQGSTAERLRASLAIGIALNPTLRVILIRDGSLLDEDSLKIVSEMAETSGMQVWIERVGTGKECQVIIEDGHAQGEA